MKLLRGFRYSRPKNRHHFFSFREPELDNLLMEIEFRAWIHSDFFLSTFINKKFRSGFFDFRVFSEPG